MTTSCGRRPKAVTGTPTIAFAYDSDNLLTAAGGLAIVRNAQNGVPQTTTVGTLSDEWTFSSFGELAGYSATASGAPLYAETLTRDTAGRITQKQETIGGSNDTYVYAYDVLGQLTQVTRNGVASESYVYDANGNRTSATSGGTTATATYDNQDRLLTFGPAAYTYSPSGNLATRSAPSGNSSYSYDARGNLVGATLPGGIAVTYLLDGLDRRLGKRVNGTATMQFLDFRHAGCRTTGWRRRCRQPVRVRRWTGAGLSDQGWCDLPPGLPIPSAACGWWWTARPAPSRNGSTTTPLAR